MSKLAEAFDNFEVWLFMSLAHGRGLWPMASCSAFRSQASGSRAGPLLPNKSAVKYRPRKASAKCPPRQDGQCQFSIGFYRSKLPSYSKTHYKIINFGGGIPPLRPRRVAGRRLGAAQAGAGGRGSEAIRCRGPPAGRPMSIFYWFLQVRMALPFKNPL